MIIAKIIPLLKITDIKDVLFKYLFNFVYREIIKELYPQRFYNAYFLNFTSRIEIIFDIRHYSTISRYLRMSMVITSIIREK